MPQISQFFGIVILMYFRPTFTRLTANTRRST